VVAFIFDVLESDGAGLRSKPWKDRRVFLERIMERTSYPIFQIKQVRGRWSCPVSRYRRTRDRGIVSKHRNAPYRSGHTVIRA
jgi:ATP-dependent DNA ligase